MPCQRCHPSWPWAAMAEPCPEALQCLPCLGSCLFLRDCWKVPTSMCCVSQAEQGGLTAFPSVFIAGAEQPFPYGSGGALSA